MIQERVLIVEDEETLRYCIAERLRQEGLEVVEAGTGGGALEAIASTRFGAMLLDLKLPDMDGLSILREALALETDLSIVILTAYGTLPRAVEAMRLGALDFRAKPLGLEDVLLVTRRALETTRLRREVRLNREKDEGGGGSGKLLYASERMRAVVELVQRVAANPSATVLLLGESGTGKGAVAEMIHRSSGRAGQRFVSITCTAIPEHLLESELFGHERGAFTDAKEMKRGLLEVADGGTAFFDEIGDMSLALQGKLLRFLEERQFRRVGGTRDIRVDVRVVGATNRNLEQAVAEGRFRADLYYRLKVVPIVVPPLRARPEDLAPLAAHFIRIFAREFKKPVREIDAATLAALQRYAWPGNVRELRNVIERAVLFCEGERITRRDLNLDPPRSSEAADLESGARFQLTRAGVDLRALEQSIVRQALEIAQGNYAAAGRLLGLTREQVKYRAEKLAQPPGVEGGRPG